MSILSKPSQIIFARFMKVYEFIETSSYANTDAQNFTKTSYNMHNVTRRDRVSRGRREMSSPLLDKGDTISFVPSIFCDKNIVVVLYRNNVLAKFKY